MSMQLNFDATNVAPATAPVPLETGWYPANIVATQEVPNSKGTGSYLEIKHRVSSGPSAGKILTSRHNIKHSNPQTVEIAYGELSAICHAVGRPRVALSSELHGGPLEVYVKKTIRTDSPGEYGNDVAGFRAIGAGGSQPGFSGAVGTQVAAAPAWAAPAQPAANAYNAPAVAVNAPQWAPPAAAAPAPQAQYAPQPATQPVAAAPAAAGSVPPWAR